MRLQKAQHQFKNLFISFSAWQTYSLFISEIANAGLWFLTTIILTRILGSEGFGVFTFYIRFTTFVQLFYRLGLFYGASLVLPHERDPQRSREIVGASLLLGMGVGIAFGISVFIFSFFVDSLFDISIAKVFRWITPVLIFFPIQALIRQIDRGLGQVSNIVLINVVPQVSFMFLVLIGYFGGFLSVEYSVITNALAIAGTCLGIGIRLKPSFQNLGHSFKILLEKTKSYGIYAYLVELTDQAASSLNSVLIPWFTSTTDLGFYTLAQALVLPITKMSYSIGMVFFKRLANSDSIPGKILWINFAWLFGSCVVIWLAADFLITHLFGPEYYAVSPLILPSIGMAFFVGAYQIYTFFLTAHEKRYVSYLSLILFPLNLIGNYWLISEYQIQGAMTFQWLRGVIWFVLIWAYYYWLIRKNKLKLEAVQD